ncbi:MAG: DNRLRE domain-containing protein [Clostridia bacterium]|nr:DNRLRE domain-containing protein [Clostridia bacterium]
MKDLFFENHVTESAALVGCRVGKAEKGSFPLTALVGLSECACGRVGAELLLLTRAEGGRACARSRSVTGTATKAAEGACLYAMESSDIPCDEGMEIILRPYVMGEDGIRRYGVASCLRLSGVDSEGYPMLAPHSNKRLSVSSSEDTFIYAAAPTADYGKSLGLCVRNTGDEDSEYFRAAYFKFTLDADAVKALDTAVAAKLRLCITHHENNPSRKQYDMLLQAVGTDWDEHTLNYSNYKAKAPTGETLHKGKYMLGAYFTVDILPYLKAQTPSGDGTVSVAFRLTGEGQKDAIVAFVGSRESKSAPVLELESSMYYPSLTLAKQNNEGYEPWGYAERIVDEWFGEMTDKIFRKNANGEPFYHDIGAFDPEGYDATEPTGDFTRKLDWKYGNAWTNDASTGYRAPKETWKTARFARTLRTLGTSVDKPFLASKSAETVSEYDVYGGISNAGFTGEATGFFHTERIGDRIYIIDPLGNPYFALGMNSVDLGFTDHQREYSVARFGSEEAYYENIIRSLKETGVNASFSDTKNGHRLLKNKLPTTISISVVLRYMIEIGCARTNFSNGFPHNDTMNVFDPDFIAAAEGYAAEAITAGGYADDPYVFGYTSDNELASGNDILIRYLTLDPSEPANGFSYATAWTWLAKRLGNPAPTLDDLYAVEDAKLLNDEFLALVYARYYRVTRAAIEAVDPHHMYMGSRINGTLYTCEPFHRVAGYYLDIITANLYGGLNPTATTVTNFYRNSGIPFIVTEFFAKGMDAIDANGYPMANSTGAGILVRTQKDRADYYEHYALAMLESKACVGWAWYCFRDNDQSCFTSTGDNRLIMLHMTYGPFAGPNTFMDVDTGKLLSAAEVGEYRTVYEGAGMHSNQNINKGIYNGTFSSTVTVYEYDKDGELVSFKGYDLKEHPQSRYPKEGTVLEAKNGDLYTVGTEKTADGGHTETILTVYKGQYVAFADAIRSIRDHMMGIIKYFDAE